MRGRYGIDAPGLVLAFGALGVLGIASSVFVYLSIVSLPPSLAAHFVGPFYTLVLFGVVSLISSAAMALSSYVGKPRVLANLLRGIRLTGDERLPDVGCGRGMLLVMAAKRLTTGRAVGVDIWRTADQSGNRPESTRTNVMREGVQDRVAIISGDARRLPFPSNRFDVVLSSLVIYDIKDREGREAALGEIVRVLKPGGRVALLDFQNTVHYADVLAKSGPLKEVGRSRVDFRMYPPVRTVTATKAPSGNS